MNDNSRKNYITAEAIDETLNFQYNKAVKKELNHKFKMFAKIIAFDSYEPQDKFSKDGLWIT